MNTMKMIRKQVRGVNREVTRQVKGVNRQVTRQVKRFGHRIEPQRSHGPGLFTGLLLLGMTCVAGALMLGKAGVRNRETIRELFRSDKGQLGNQQLLSKLQNQFSGILEHVGIHRENGKQMQTENEPVGAGRHGHIQTMGDV